MNNRKNDINFLEEELVNEDICTENENIDNSTDETNDEKLYTQKDLFAYTQERDSLRKEQEWLKKIQSSNYIIDLIKINFVPSYTRRFIGFFIDYVLATQISKMITFMIQSFINHSFDVDLWLICFIVYSAVSILITGGYTIGKILTGIKIKRLDDEKLDVNTVFFREVVGKFIMIRIPLLYIFMIFTKNRQSLADIFADTVVTNDNYQKTVEDLRNYIENN